MGVGAWSRSAGAAGEHMSRLRQRRSPGHRLVALAPRTLPLSVSLTMPSDPAICPYLRRSSYFRHASQLHANPWSRVSVS